MRCFPGKLLLHLPGLQPNLAYDFPKFADSAEKTYIPCSLALYILSGRVVADAKSFLTSTIYFFCQNAAAFWLVPFSVLFISFLVLIHFLLLGFFDLLFRVETRSISPQRDSSGLYPYVLQVVKVLPTSPQTKLPSISLQLCKINCSISQYLIISRRQIHT